MQSINLLPIELRPKKLDRRSLLIRSGVTVVVLACLAGYGFFLAKIYLSQKEGERVAAEMAALQPELRRVEAIEKEINDNRKKAELLNQLQSARVPWSKVFNEVTGVTPDGLWLATVTLNTIDPAKTVLEIEGETVAFEQVGVFVLKLRTFPYFSSVELIDARDKNVDFKWVTRFKVQALLAPIPPELQVVPVDSNGKDGTKKSGAQGGERR
ncbi:hypothetical protein GTO89_09610 [Heliobacterium gestii]|uniref:PilN domain-containing protein n=1 Tax=Heliomicrobium gestii TaxID=2699 RepID=A0A845LD45_HELGE|nr:PilN domain-containing protein [Heliomicrobium gestii]MBM7867894.1 type IV pilus assembly protein PilN [Heliomicrobium gestii]MZP43294.1 hypothetical protein [Heliomicrobium gestii]